MVFPCQNPLFESRKLNQTSLIIIIHSILRKNPLFNGYLLCKSSSQDILLLFLEGNLVEIGEIDQTSNTPITPLDMSNFLENIDQVSTNVSLYNTDFELVQMMIVLWQNAPTILTNTDLVDLEKLFGQIETAKKAAVIRFTISEKIVLCKTESGVVTHVYLPQDIKLPSAGDDLRENLLLLIYQIQAKKQIILINVYENSNVNNHVDVTLLPLDFVPPLIEIYQKIFYITAEIIEKNFGLGSNVVITKKFEAVRKEFPVLLNDVQLNDRGRKIDSQKVINNLGNLPILEQTLTFKKLLLRLIDTRLEILTELAGKKGMKALKKHFNNIVKEHKNSDLTPFINELSKKIG